jgi:hypothetical protein
MLASLLATGPASADGHGYSYSDKVTVRVLANGTLDIRGDNLANKVTLCASGANAYEVRIASDDGEIVETATGATGNVRVYLRGGDDRLSITGSVCGSSVSFPRDLLINLGSGHDSMDAYNFEVGDDMSVIGGSGDEDIAIWEAYVDDRADFRTASGMSTIGVYEAGFGRTSLIGGPQVDLIEIEETYLGRTAMINTNAGDDSIIALDTGAGGRITAALGGGSDYLLWNDGEAIEDRLGYNLNLLMGSGDDETHLLDVAGLSDRYNGGGGTDLLATPGFLDGPIVNGYEDFFFIGIETLIEPGIVEEGLNNPRGIDVDHLGNIFVAEAGDGGSALVETRQGDSDGPVCVGETGSLSQPFAPAAASVGQFPSVAAAVEGACSGPGFGFGTTGVHAVEVLGNQTSVVVGLGGTGEIRDALATGDASAALFGTAIAGWGQAEWSADITAFEDAVDPDGNGADSNPYGVARGEYGTTLVADAGANALFRTYRNGYVETVAVFHPICVPWEQEFPNPVPPEANPCGDPDQFPADSVPTDVAVDANGDYLVTTLLGFPFNPGHSVVYKVAGEPSSAASCASFFPPAHQIGCEVFSEGHTALVGIDVDSQGFVYVAQLADAGLLAFFGGQDEGSVKMLDGETGDTIESFGGYQAPGGLAVTDDGIYLLLTTNSVSPTDGRVEAIQLPR